jgi:hypothetical protein
MANMRSQSTDNHVGNPNGPPKDNQETSEDACGDPTQPLSDLNSAPPPIDQTIFDRLNAKLDQEQAEGTDNLQKQSLDELGRLIQQWRLKLGYTRGVLAGKLQMNVTQLLCIENGIAEVEDIPAEQLLILKALLPEDDADALRVAIEAYLALLAP